MRNVKPIEFSIDHLLMSLIKLMPQSGTYLPFPVLCMSPQGRGIEYLVVFQRNPFQMRL